MSEQSDTSDSTLPDTAMATGNDQGEFGHPDSRPLAEDERKLLKKLQKAKGEAEPAVEDSPEVAAAVADDAPLPSAQVAGGNDDGLDARFTDR
ncbi:hypothetical protein [Modestobacter sp. SSW1-42]|uniref:hypothetical protein n=1 Tax=Modestobacter sp. SSW1-42 TaxID=596372 RepID=UPI003986E6B3